MDTVELGLDLALQHRERSSQLVGDVGEEATARLVRGLELARHVVERPPERADARGPAGRPERLVPATEPLGAVEQVADRAGQAAVGDERGDDRGDDDGDDDGRPPRPSRPPPASLGDDAENHAEPDPDHRDDDGDAEESAPPPVRAWGPCPPCRCASGRRAEAPRPCA